MFDWSQTKEAAIPTIRGLEVGVAVLVGDEEQTLITLTTGSHLFDNGTTKVVPAAVLSIDTRHSRAGDKTGVATPTPVTLKQGETNLTLRVLVDVALRFIIFNLSSSFLIQSPWF